MTATLEAANESMRKAVRERLDATPADDPKMVGYVTKPLPECISAEVPLHESCCEGRKFYGHSLLNERPGTTAKFGTGAVRSDTFEEFRYDLVSPIGLREVARACAEGAEKYGDWNWEKGMPVHDLLNHAIAHIYGFLSGDRSEPHLGHAAWNVLAAIHSHELWPHLNYPSLRRPGCLAPDENGP